MSIGSWFKRKWVSLYTKIVREKASPEYIARGWAIGMFYGLLIPFGLQLACSVPTAFLLKGSKIGSVFGTLVTNHVTIFFIYPFQCWLGNRLCGGDLSQEQISKAMQGILQEQSWNSLLSLGKDLVISFFAGGLLFALIATPLTYIFIRQTVIRYRLLREKRGKK